MNTEVLILVMWVCSVWYPQLVTSQRCRDGYQLSPEFVCVDTDECETYGDPSLIIALCGSYTLCHNVPGSYYCTCQQGYVSPSGTTNFTLRTDCEELNECVEVPNICGANALCHNTLGSFSCQCRQGFFYISDAFSGCVDINECQSVPCGSNATCHNTKGGFRCECDKGFVSNTGTPSFNTTMNYCKDRDECESSPCGSNETCHNTEGSFHCTFDPGSASRNNTTNHSEDGSGCSSKNETKYPSINEINFAGQMENINNCKDHTDCHQQISKLLQDVKKHVLMLARTLGHEEKQNFSSSLFEVEMQTIHNNKIPEEKNTRLSAGGNSLDISWKSVTRNESFDSASVALISYKNLDSIINGSFHNNQTDPADVVSDIVTLAISNNQSNELLEPVTLTLRNRQQNVNKSQLQCVSWDLKEGIWSTNGCVVLRANKTHIECSSRRVASFAVLMAFHDLKDHVHSLNVITLVGIIVSLICLAIALFTFIFCRSIKGVRTTIHTHLCLSLFLAELLFLVGISRTENQVMCFVIAGTLHYLLLVCFSWMLLEGVQLYVMVVQVFHTKSLRPRYMVIFGYGLPLLIVGISVAISEGYVAENYCWLDFKSGWLWAFVAPVCVIILINATIFVIMVYKLAKKFSTLNPDMENLRKVRMFTFTAIAQLCLLGCTWLIGVFHFQDDTIVMTYIFTIINSGQGVFIFILHCLFNKQIRDEYVNCCTNMCRLTKPSKYSEFSTFSTQGLKSTQETGI